MQLPMQITFRNMKSSDAIEAHIREEVAKLETFYDRLISCRVMIELFHHSQLHIRLDLSVPGGEIVVKREPKKDDGAHAKTYVGAPPSKDIYVALHEAFKTARRQLQQYARKQNGAVKQHESLPVAQVTQVFPEKDYGFLRTPEGEELYFHRNSVLHDGFAQMTVGSLVTFVAEPGEKGPQASTVRLQRKAQEV